MKFSVVHVGWRGCQYKYLRKTWFFLSQGGNKLLTKNTLSVFYTVCACIVN